jgi:hypothetical protein
MNFQAIKNQKKFTVVAKIENDKAGPHQDAIKKSA